MWFKKLMGFEEENPEQVRKNISIVGTKLVLNINSKEYEFGRLQVSSLKELREEVKNLDIPKGKLSISKVVADVRDLHVDVSNKDALFQVASQFNLLEMISPDVFPEGGVDRYESDFTQGPACAIACGAGTIYRNYFVELEKSFVKRQIGQTADL